MASLHERRRWEQRVYAALLRAYPRMYREEYGADMKQAFTDLLGDKDLTARQRARLLAREAWGVLSRGVLERLSGDGMWRTSFSAVLSGRARSAVDVVTQDVRFGLRSLARSPGFTLLAVLTLALGIGASAIVSSGVDAVLLRPMEGRDASRLVMLLSPGMLSYPEFVALDRENEVLSGVSAIAATRGRLGVDGRSTGVLAEFVSSDYFEVVGLPPFRGRSFVAEDEQGPGHPVAILSHETWVRLLDADPEAIGSTIRLNGHPLTLVGIAPEGFTGSVGLFAIEVWVPLPLWGTIGGGSADFLSDPEAGELLALGRLKAGIGRAEAETAIRALEERIRRRWSTSEPGRATGEQTKLVTPRGLTGWARDLARPYAALLTALATLVLLIACANVANLMLARAARRRRELAVRAALGAGRHRLVSQLLTESLVLSLAGGLLGFLLAVPTVDTLLDVEVPSSASFPSLVPPDFRMDHRVMGVALGLALLSTLFFGLIPVRRASRLDVTPELKEGGLTTPGRRGRGGPQGALVVTQLSVSLVLLITAGLLVRSLVAAYDIDPGFDTEAGLVMTLQLDEDRYDEASGSVLFDGVRERVTAHPGVVTAGWASYVPVAGGHPATAVEIDRGDVARPSVGEARIDIAGPGFFEALGTPPVTGRAFGASDGRGSPPVIIVNQRFAAWAWPGENPIGKRVRFGSGGVAVADAPYHEVVGVVPDVRYANSFEGSYSAVYRSMAQRYAPSMSLLVRTSGDPGTVAADIVQAAWSVDRSLPRPHIVTLREHTTSTVQPLRMLARFAMGAGLLAALLATVGVYALIAYTVAGRTREIGIRMALGAHRLAVRRLVVGYGARLIAAGVLLGVVGAVLVNRVLSGLFYGIGPVDGVVLAFGAILVVITGLVASLAPSARATRVDPVHALRVDG